MQGGGCGGLIFGEEDLFALDFEILSIIMKGIITIAIEIISRKKIVAN